MTLKKREQLGVGLVRGGAVKPVSQSSYMVASQSGSGHYSVTWDRNHWMCRCPDYLDDRKCKHVYAVQYFLLMRNIVASTDDNSESGCPYCHSTQVIKRGHRYSRIGPTQRYYCKVCKRRFSRTVLKRSKSIAAVITAALDLYF